MKAQAEIQRVHDILAGILDGSVDLEAVGIGPNTYDAINAVCDAFCWMLEHDHNTKFAENLERLEEKLAAAGYRLVTKQ